MSEPKPIPWDELSDGSRSVIVGIVKRLASGFTGRIELDCTDGDVRQVRPTRFQSPRDFERDAA